MGVLQELVTGYVMCLGRCARLEMREMEHKGQDRRRPGFNPVDGLLYVRARERQGCMLYVQERRRTGWGAFDECWN